MYVTMNPIHRNDISYQRTMTVIVWANI